MTEYLRSFLRRPPIGWWDVLDILIVSFVIYEFLKLIRGTRAVQMATGVLLIVGLFYISRLAPLSEMARTLNSAPGASLRSMAGRSHCASRSGSVSARHTFSGG